MAAAEAFAALGNEVRLAVFRALVPIGPGGIPAGRLAERLGLPPASLSFHLTRLKHAGLIASRREGRQLFYAARYETIRSLIDFLTESCCAEQEGGCPPACGSQRTKEKKETLS